MNRSSVSFVRDLRVSKDYLWVEPVVGGAAGLILFFADAGDIAQLTWILSGFVLVGRLAYGATLREQMIKIDKLAETVDLSRDADVGAVAEILSLYLRIGESEFRRVKEAVLSEAIEKLSRVANDKRSEVLATVEYYSWLLPILRTTGKGSEIWAISMMMDCEWDDSEAEKRFLRENIEAAKRGVSVRRVFVINEHDSDALAVNPGIAAHLDPQNSIDSLTISRNWLIRHDAALLEDLGSGCIAFDRRVLLIDQHSDDGSARGIVTMNGADIRRWRSMFESLLPHCASLRDRIRFVPQSFDGES